MKLSPKEKEALLAAARLASFEEGWCLTGTRQIQIRVIRRLVDKGLMRFVGPCVLSDGDGWHHEPEREVDGYQLTDAGMKAIASFVLDGAV